MKTLVVDEWLSWPLDNGKKIRTYNLLVRLARRHELTLVAYGSRQREPEAVQRLEDSGIRVRLVEPPTVHKSGLKGGIAAAWSALRGLPYSAALYVRPDLIRGLHQVARDCGPDLVHVETTILGPVAGSELGVPRVLGTHNFEARIWERLASNESSPLRCLAYRAQAGLMQRFERRVLREFESITAVSEEDAALLGALVGRDDIAIVPNGVDIEHFRVHPRSDSAHSLVFTGALDWRPTQDAVRHFLRTTFPAIRREFADARITIAGRDPDAGVRQVVTETPGAILLANVPDIRVPVVEAAVSVAPLRSGSGSRLKILEAMAMGRPVVATTVGAEGLGAVDGRHVLIADDPEQFVRSVTRLWTDDHTYRSIAENARRFVEERYDWEIVASRLERVWEQAVEGRST